MATINNKDFQLDDNATVQSLKILINQCWKTLPIFEGKNKENQIVYSREEAFVNYHKHLCCLITIGSGDIIIWLDKHFYVELVYILVGMQDFTEDEHDRVKYIVHHCTKLINNMIEMVLNDES